MLHFSILGPILQIIGPYVIRFQVPTLFQRETDSGRVSWLRDIRQLSLPRSRDWMLKKYYSTTRYYVVHKSFSKIDRCRALRMMLPPAGRANEIWREPYSYSVRQYNSTMYCCTFSETKNSTRVTTSVGFHTQQSYLTDLQYIMMIVACFFFQWD